MQPVADHRSTELQENASLVPVAAFTSNRDDVTRSSHRRSRQFKRKSSAIDVAMDDDEEEDEDEEPPPKKTSRKRTSQGIHGAMWDAMFQLLLGYKNKHGDTLVPYGYHADPKLGNWVSTQRIVYAKKELLDHRVRRLNYIGFVWKQCRPWIDVYQRLVSYKEDHGGSTLVPSNYGADPQLGNWVHEQRQLLRKKKLPQDRITLLKSINFKQDANEVIRNIKWTTMYRRLVSYKEEHGGSTLVPKEYEQDPQLGSWVSTQRQRCKKKERVKLLNDIHFVWSARK